RFPQRMLPEPWSVTFHRERAGLFAEVGVAGCATRAVHGKGNSLGRIRSATRYGDEGSGDRERRMRDRLLGVARWPCAQAVDDRLCFIQSSELLKHLRSTVDPVARPCGIGTVQFDETCEYGLDNRLRLGVAIQRLQRADLCTQYRKLQCRCAVFLQQWQC